MIILAIVFIAFVFAFTGHSLLAITFSQICLVLELWHKIKIESLQQKLFSQKQLLFVKKQKFLTYEKQ